MLTYFLLGFQMCGTPGEPSLLGHLAGMVCHQQPDDKGSPTQDPRHRHSVTQSFTRVHGHLLARLVIRTGTLQTTTTARTPKEHDASARERKPATATQSGCHSGTNMRQRQFTWVTQRRRTNASRSHSQHEHSSILLHFTARSLGAVKPPSPRSSRTLQLSLREYLPTMVSIVGKAFF